MQWLVADIKSLNCFNSYGCEIMESFKGFAGISGKRIKDGIPMNTRIRYITILKVGRIEYVILKTQLMMSLHKRIVSKFLKSYYFISFHNFGYLQASTNQTAL